jgi:hypothetical protein
LGANTFYLLMIAKIWTSSIKASMILEKADRVLVFLVVFFLLQQLFSVGIR